jgi:hypothetical protein
LDFRLFVMFSPGDELMLPEQHAEHCTSVSYCGLQDEEYPDTRHMGYPFSRPFQGGIVRRSEITWCQKGNLPISFVKESAVSLREYPSGDEPFSL